jgi:hypothetical protein
VDVKNFSPEQQKALLDLAMLAMYADGHLAAAEDERVIRLLNALGFASEYAQQSAYDEAIGRVSRHSQNSTAAREHVAALAKLFSSIEERRQVYSIVSDLVGSDSHVAPTECIYLTVAREALHL